MANLSAVLRHLQKQRAQAARTLAQLDAAINALDGTGRSPQRGGRRRLSAAARRRIAAAQKARWAKWRAKRG